MLETEAVVTTPEASAPPPAPVETDDAPESAADDSADNGNSDDGLDRELYAIWQRDNPERDEAGRFRARSKPNEAEATTETQVQTDQPPAAEPEQVKPAIPPPQSWSADEKAEWNALPPKAQEAILRREREATTHIQRQGTELRAYEPLKSVIEQHKDIFERNGVQPHDGISRLLAAERMLESDPDAAIGQLAQAYGVDLRKFAGAPTAGNATEAALHRKVADLERRLVEVDSKASSYEQYRAQEQEAALKSTIAKFAEGKPEWAEIETDILKEITGINANIDAGLLEPMTPDQKLAEAYERAVRNNPAMWARKQAEKKAEEEARRIAEAKKRAETAAKAKAVAGNSNPATTRAAPDLDDELMAIWRRRNG